MPEGHTLRRLADALTEAFAGQLTRVSSPQGRFAAEAALLDGTRFRGADSVGKHLFCEFDADRIVHVHLGLIGHFDVRVVDAAAVPPPLGQVRLRLATQGASGAAYADLRGATRCALVTPGERDTVLARLGPDPLRPEAEPGPVWQRVSRSDRPIGDLLMDQSVVAGVGNVYRAEVLFRHRLHPWRPGRTLRRAQVEAIWADLVALMGEGVRTGRIDTVRHEHTPEAMGRPPRRDDHGGEVYVYRRTGQPCLVCGHRVRTATLAGRNAFWCPHCQRTFRSRAVR
ncbi:MAG: DNA-formamidopyrimidine glycosylase family protein [Nocardioides sp.]